ncbi:hypothetical protein HNO53_20570 [Billgrantia antri]|uniref:Uncharacterized protein n=1 Tax=Halomonas sulfidivorans TaxID=2733488 RepID=A0ABX7WL10_9GAMM|nr:hypothetical protein [Halomonas sulfidivorans]QTP60894.1 hypothetical protein HNO53_20570 [Halomonas sulfidivorans]
MTKPTHTHRAQGGRFEQVDEQMGGGVLEGQLLVIYRDIDKDVTSATTEGDWRQHWRPIAKDDCPVCLGAGHDQIKKAKHQPCGGCFGLGKVKADGEKPADLWQLADVALGIIKRQQHELEQRRQAMALPEVAAALQAEKEARITDSVAHQEQQWRDGKGHGPGGRRYVGD